MTARYDHITHGYQETLAELDKITGRGLHARTHTHTHTHTHTYKVPGTVCVCWETKALHDGELHITTEFLVKN